MDGIGCVPTTLLCGAQSEKTAYGNYICEKGLCMKISVNNFITWQFIIARYVFYYALCLKSIS